MTRTDADPEASRPGRRSIVDFLTDGSLARLCAELSDIAGARVVLLDPDHRAIEADETGWRLADAPTDLQQRAPILVEGREIGSIGVWTPDGSVGERVVRTAGLVASAAGEVCAHVVEAEHRSSELGVLFRLTGLLVRAMSVGRVIEVALESALDVFGLDAGSVMLFPDTGVGSEETEENLVRMASKGLSAEWLDTPYGLSKGRVFDTMALDGEVVTSADLLDDDRVELDDLVRREGVRSFISAGMVFKNEPIGVIRLYGREARSFDDAERRLLRSIGQQAALAVEQTRLLTLQEEERRLQAQVRLASDVQRRMFPDVMPRFPGMDVSARTKPSLQLGGDFHDVFAYAGGVGLVVGDVVGKGVAAALLMAHVRASLRAHADTIDDPAEVIRRVNRDMCRDTLENEFATVWFGRLREGELAYCSAGHDPALVVTSEGTSELNPGGLVVGIDPEHDGYSVEERTLDEGDVLVVYSDGFTDARSFEGGRFGRERLRGACARGAGVATTAAGVLEHVRWELRQFVGLSTQVDDETLVVARIGG